MDTTGSFVIMSNIFAISGLNSYYKGMRKHTGKKAKKKSCERTEGHEIRKPYQLPATRPMLRRICFGPLP
jgi:hypothetical protein